MTKNRLVLTRQRCERCGALIEFVVSAETRSCCSAKSLSATVRRKAGLAKPASQTRTDQRPLRGKCAACEFIVVVGSENGRVVAGSVDWVIDRQPSNFALASPSANSRPRLEDVLSPTVLALRSHWWTLLWITLACGVPWVMVLSLMLWAMPRIAEVAGEGIGGFATAFVCIGLCAGSLLFATAYLVAVLARTCLDFLRYAAMEGASASSLVARAVPARVIMRLVMLMMLALLVILGAMLIGVGAMLASVLLLDPSIAPLVGMIAAASVVLLLVVVMQWLLWPAVFLIADRRAGILGSLDWSMRLSWHHGRLSLVLIVVYAALTTAGSLLFYVGQLLVLPIVLMPMAAGYLRMTRGEMLGDR